MIHKFNGVLVLRTLCIIGAILSIASCPMPPSTPIVQGGRFTYQVAVSVVRGAEIEDIVLTSSSGAFERCTPSDNLGSLGLSVSLEGRNCVISGTISPIAEMGANMVTITAANSIASSVAVVIFNISAPAPEAPRIVYQPTIPLVQGMEIDNIVLTSSGGAVESCTPSSNLTGLGLSVVLAGGNCVISGMVLPAATTGESMVTITATNSSDSSEFIVIFSVSAPSPEVPQIVYRPIITLVQGTAIENIVLTNINGTVEMCDSSSNLAGLGLSVVLAGGNCVISGMVLPAATTGASRVTITARNSTVSSEAVVILSIVAPTPEAPRIVYRPTIPLVQGVAINDIVLTNINGTVESCTPSSNLAGLGLSVALVEGNCVISGTVSLTAATGERRVTITAANSSDSSEAIVVFTISGRPPSISDRADMELMQGMSLSASPIVFTNTGGAITSCSPSGNLQSNFGLTASLVNGNCVISGTVSNSALPARVIITASNAWGQSMASIQIGIQGSAVTDTLLPAISIPDTLRRVTINPVNLVRGQSIDPIIFGNVGGDARQCESVTISSLLSSRPDFDPNNYDPPTHIIPGSVPSTYQPLTNIAALGLEVVLVGGTCVIQGTVSDSAPYGTHIIRIGAENSLAGSSEAPLLFTIEPNFLDLDRGKPVFHYGRNELDNTRYVRRQVVNATYANNGVAIDSCSISANLQAIGLTASVVGGNCVVSGTVLPRRIEAGQHRGTITVVNGTASSEAIFYFDYDTIPPNIANHPAITITRGSDIYYKNPIVFSSTGGDIGGCFLDNDIPELFSENGLRVERLHDGNCHIIGTVPAVTITRTVRVTASNAFGRSTAEVEIRVPAAFPVPAPNISAPNLANPNIITLERHANVRVHLRNSGGPPRDSVQGTTNTCIGNDALQALFSSGTSVLPDKGTCVISGIVSGAAGDHSVTITQDPRQTPLDLTIRIVENEPSISDSSPVSIVAGEIPPHAIVFINTGEGAIQECTTTGSLPDGLSVVHGSFGAGRADYCRIVGTVSASATPMVYNASVSASNEAGSSVGSIQITVTN